MTRTATLIRMASSWIAEAIILLNASTTAYDLAECQEISRLTEQMIARLEYVNAKICQDGTD